MKTQRAQLPLFLSLAILLALPPLGRTDEAIEPQGVPAKAVRVAAFKAKAQASAELAKAVTALMAQALAGAPCVRLITEESLAEKARRQMMGESCEGASSCEESAAQGVHADLLVRGEVIQIGQSYIATAWLLEVATQKILFSGKATAQDATALMEQTQTLAARTAAALACPES